MKVYATRDTAIDGKHFAQDEEVKGVDQGQIDYALAQGYVTTTKPGDAPPAPKPPKRTTKPAPATSEKPLDTDSAAALVKAED